MCLKLYLTFILDDFKQAGNILDECNCRIPCHEMKYGSIVSSSKYPTDVGAENDAIYYGTSKLVYIVYFGKL